MARGVADAVASRGTRRDSKGKAPSNSRPITPAERCSSKAAVVTQAPPLFEGDDIEYRDVRGRWIPGRISAIDHTDWAPTYTVSFAGLGGERSERDTERHRLRLPACRN